MIALVSAMGVVFLCLLFVPVQTAQSDDWSSWLKNFGRGDYVYPSWITEQRNRCKCEFSNGIVICHDGGTVVDWLQATDLTWCASMHFLLKHMPEFDLHFLPGSVTVQGHSMLDDNVAFSLMSWKASVLDPKPPIKLVFQYLLPYANLHEARTNWRPLFFAKYFQTAANLKSSQQVVDKFIRNNNDYMNWSSFNWPNFAGKSPGNVYNLGPFVAGSSPPSVAPFDVISFGYASCTGWANMLVSALKSVGVPAREVGSPVWNIGSCAGMAVDNPNVTSCWDGTGTMQNHNWVEYWNNKLKRWSFLDVATSSSAEDTWFCGRHDSSTGCTCLSNAGKSSRDHDVLVPTWSAIGDDPDLHGGPVLNVSSDLRLSNGISVSPLVWNPKLRSPFGTPLKDVGLRVVNRTEFYRCKSASAGGNVQLSRKLPTHVLVARSVF